MWPPQRLIDVLLDTHVHGAAREYEMDQKGIVRPALHQKETDKTIVSVIVDGSNAAGLIAEAAELPAEVFDVLRRVEPSLGIVQLVRAVDQLHYTIEIRLDVAVDSDADVACAQEFLVRERAGASLFHLALEELVLLQPRHLRI